jgi:hypothetical protein
MAPLIGFIFAESAASASKERVDLAGVRTFLNNIAGDLADLH